MILFVGYKKIKNTNIFLNIDKSNKYFSEKIN